MWRPLLALILAVVVCQFADAGPRRAGSCSSAPAASADAAVGLPHPVRRVWGWFKSHRPHLRKGGC